MINQKLKEALKKAGINEGLADLINITAENQIEGIVNQLKSTQTEDSELDYSLIIKSKGFTDYIKKKGGFTKFIEETPILKSGHDSAVTNAINTNKRKILKELANDSSEDLGQTPVQSTEQGTKQNEDTPVWAKTLMAKVDAFEKNTQQSSKLEQAKAVLDASKISTRQLKKELGK